MSAAHAPPDDLRLSLEATLRFARRSGAWVVPGVASAGSGEPGRTGETLDEIRSALGDCRRCRLWQDRSHVVFGTGDPGARVVFVGEAPGYHEDRRGEPFVGRAGRLLDRMVAALGWSRSEVYIANVLKCRPPDNRDPAADEVAACTPFLERQLAAIRPAVICALGAHAARALLGVEGPMTGRWGKPAERGGVPVVPTFHPAFLLRNPAAKRRAWEHLKTVSRLVRDRDPGAVDGPGPGR